MVLCTNDTGGGLWTGPVVVSILSSVQFHGYGCRCKQWAHTHNRHTLDKTAAAE